MRPRPGPEERTPDEAAENGGLRLVAGIQPVREVIRVRAAELDRVLLDQARPPKLQALERFARDQGVKRIDWAEKSLLDRAARGVMHQGALAWAPPLSLRDPAELLTRPDFLGVALDGVEDPQNFGAVVRSAVALGRAPIFWGEHSSAPLSPAMFRASAGAVEHAELCRVPSLRTLLEQARDLGIAVVGLDPAARDRLAEVDFGQPTLLVLGSEGRGLGRGVRAACSRLVCLGPLFAVESLNVSATAAIVLYEASTKRINSKP